MIELTEILVVHPRFGLICQGQAVKVDNAWQIKNYKAIYHPMQTRHIETMLGYVTEDFTVWVESSTSIDSVCATKKDDTHILTTKDTVNAKLTASAPELLETLIYGLDQQTRLYVEMGFKLSEESYSFCQYLNTIEKATGIRPKLNKCESDIWWEHPMIQGK